MTKQHASAGAGEDGGKRGEAVGQGGRPGLQDQRRFDLVERAALHCGTPDYAARAIEWGFHMTTVSGDSRLLAGAAGASVAKFRQLAGQIGSGFKKGAY